MKLQLTLDSFAVILYCGDLIPSKYQPLSNDEWHEVEKQIKKSSIKDVSRLFGMNFEKLTQIVGLDEYLAYKILSRNTLLADLFYSLRHLESENIQVTTKYEDNYPQSLLALKSRAPLILYYVGDLSLVHQDNVSVVGPKKSTNKLNFSTKNIVTKVYDENRVLIASGIKGVDNYAIKHMLSLGGKVIIFVAEQMFEKKKEYKRYIDKGQVLLLSAVDPFAYFNVTNSLDRNIYVCGLSSVQFVVATTINSGQVWFTTMQNMHYQWTKQLILKIKSQYNGNLRLLEMGATPVSDEDLLSLMSINDIIDKNTEHHSLSPLEIDQMSIYEFIGE